MMKSFFVLLMVLGSLHLHAGTTDVCVQDEEAVDVKLEKGNPTDDDTYPRTLIPILCTYADGIVQLTLFTDLGDFTLIVTNQTSGEKWSTVNTLTLPTSNAAGSYLIQIVTEDGSVYWGTYTL